MQVRPQENGRLQPPNIFDVALTVAEQLHNTTPQAVLLRVQQFLEALKEVGTAEYCKEVQEAVGEVCKWLDFLDCQASRLCPLSEFAA